MKKMLLYFLVVSFFKFSTITTAQTFNSTTTIAENGDDPISGAWLSVDNKDFIIMSDGFFSSVAQDSTGKWTETHVGSYILDNTNTITFKVNHSSFAYRIGYLHTIEYELNGDNLTIIWYKKMIDNKGNDLTARMPKDQRI